MLTQTIGTGGGKNSDVVAKQHIRKFESILTNDLLIPLHDALRNHISHLEEYQYLFVSIHRIFSDILAHYRTSKSNLHCSLTIPLSCLNISYWRM